MTHFHLFSLPASFDIDQHALETSYFAQQRRFHPDRFVGKPAEERVAALQHSADVNKAYETLKSPLKRAQYLLHLQGIEVGTDGGGIKPTPALLTEVLEWREQVAEANTPVQIKALKADLHALHEDLLARLSAQAAKADWAAMTEATLKLGYVLKTQEELKIQEVKLRKTP